MNGARATQWRLLRPARPAFLLMSVLVCLTLAIALFAAATRTLVRERNLLAAQQNALQADLLADAGLERAKAQLAANAEFRDEVWQLADEQLAGQGTASVTISSATVPDRPNERQLKAVARLQGRGAAVQQTRETIYTLSRLGEQP